MGYRVGAGQRWTNRSVLAFAGALDPINAILEEARKVTMVAIDAGWEGPPFDPIKLAELRGIRVMPLGDVVDARTRLDSDERFVIEVNPLRPRIRQRFSIAHEIAHTFFPDCAETVRHRLARAEADEDRWELEALCNIAAAELLMPLGSMPEGLQYGSIDQTLALRAKYEVSVEAVAIRSVQLATAPLAMFSASKIEGGSRAGRYKLDYAIESRTSNLDLKPGEVISEDSPIRFCTAIGYTQKGLARFGGADTHVECVGVGGYPGATHPRVVGYLHSSVVPVPADQPGLTYLVGDASKPEYEGVGIVVFMTNDVTPNWGGGLARQVAIKQPDVQIAFRKLASESPEALTLGSVHLLRADDELYYAPVVAQHGVGKSEQPRIRYQALEEALRKLGVRAGELGASIHMPRIGAGLAGGNWNVIREIIQERLVPFADVYVYDLPQRLKKSA